MNITTDDRAVKGQESTDICYDSAGRLTEAQETPTGGQCTSRAYTYDADSNRLTKTTRAPGLGGACATSGGTTQGYGYDGADRLVGPTYDAWGRITDLPAEFAGGKALETSYFANDMVATQSQGGVTNAFQLDATGRQRQREQAGGVAGTEIFHYDGPGDSPSWIMEGGMRPKSDFNKVVLGLPLGETVVEIRPKLGRPERTIETWEGHDEKATVLGYDGWQITFVNGHLGDRTHSE